ncbi:MAG: biopolymer transporter ExbD [Lentisphaerales bacterium]|jgi:biopolymer transport protein ExbD|nr:MAG: biopolymer transporter ExbD [Lentisphaerales bacterium]
MRFRSKAQTEPARFQMAPMLDVIFLLLCFSIASQIYARWETEIDITLPTAETGETPRRLPGEIILNVRQDGAIVFNGQILDRERVASLLEDVVRLFPNQPVLIRADGRTDYENVVRILDICRRCDVWNISFATGVPEEDNR